MKKIAIIKFGGHAFENEESISALVKNIKSLQKSNYNVIVAHGGTPSVKRKLKEKNVESQMVDGYRITTKEIMETVQEAILGKEVIDIVKLLNKNEIASLALNGTDCNLIKCEKFKHKNNIDYGYVGQIVNINNGLLYTLLDKNIVPVISPIGVDDNGNSYNLNSDYLASKIAESIDADILFMVTNIDGIRMDINDENTRIKVLDMKKTQKLIGEGIIKPAMETKVNACLDFVKTNKVAFIINSNQLIDDNLLSSNYGTKIVNNLSDFEIRLAVKNDIDNIINVMHNSFDKYQENIDYKIAPLLETNIDVLKDINNKFVFVGIKDGKIVSSARLDINNTQARISRVCVLKEYQNIGLGSKMLKFIEAYAANKGVLIVGLTTLDNVDYLENFYKKNGYTNKIVNTSRGYKRSLMWKKLDNNIKINTNWFIV